MSVNNGTRIADQIVADRKSSIANADNVKTNSEEGKVPRQLSTDNLQQAGRASTIIDTTHSSSKRMLSKPWKTALVKPDGMQNLRIPRNSNVKTVHSSNRILQIDNIRGETATNQRTNNTKRPILVRD